MSIGIFHFIVKGPQTYLNGEIPANSVGVSREDNGKLILIAGPFKNIEKAIKIRDFLDKNICELSLDGYFKNIFGE